MYNDCEEPLRTEEECMMVLSITDFSETQNFSIFPNPTTGAITIEGNGLNRVEIYDIQGRKPALAPPKKNSTSRQKTRHPFGRWRGFAESNTGKKEKDMECTDTQRGYWQDCGITVV